MFQPVRATLRQGHSYTERERERERERISIKVLEVKGTYIWYTELLQDHSYTEIL